MIYLDGVFIVVAVAGLLHRACRSGRYTACDDQG